MNTRTTLYHIIYDFERNYLSHAQFLVFFFGGVVFLGSPTSIPLHEMQDCHAGPMRFLAAKAGNSQVAERLICKQRMIDLLEPEQVRSPNHDAVNLLNSFIGFKQGEGRGGKCRKEKGTEEKDIQQNAVRIEAQSIGTSLKPRKTDT